MDRHVDKRAKAISFGADAAFEPGQIETPGKLDAVIDAVGSADILQQGLPLLRRGGSHCIYGVLTQPVLHIDKSKGDFNFNVLVHQWPTRKYERESQPQLCQWIREGKLTSADFERGRDFISQGEAAAGPAQFLEHAGQHRGAQRRGGLAGRERFAGEGRGAGDQAGGQRQAGDGQGDKGGRADLALYSVDGRRVRTIASGVLAARADSVRRETLMTVRVQREQKRSRSSPRSRTTRHPPPAPGAGGSRCRFR